MQLGVNYAGVEKNDKCGTVGTVDWDGEWVLFVELWMWRGNGDGKAITISIKFENYQVNKPIDEKVFAVQEKKK